MGRWGYKSTEADGPHNWYTVQNEDGRAVLPSGKSLTALLKDWLGGEDDGTKEEGLAEFIGIVLLAIEEKAKIDKRFLLKAKKNAEILLKTPGYVDAFKKPQARTTALQQEIKQIEEYLKNPYSLGNKVASGSKAKNKAAKYKPKKITKDHKSLMKEIEQELEEIRSVSEYANCSPRIQRDTLGALVSKVAVHGKIKGKPFTAKALFASLNGTKTESFSFKGPKLEFVNFLIEGTLRLNVSRQSEILALKKMGFNFKNVPTDHYRGDDLQPVAYEERIKTAPFLSLKFGDYFLLEEPDSMKAQIYIKIKCPEKLSKLVSKLKLPEEQVVRILREMADWGTRNDFWMVYDKKYLVAHKLY